jgi:hypothetical protein
MLTMAIGGAVVAARPVAAGARRLDISAMLSGWSFGLAALIEAYDRGRPPLVHGIIVG